MAPPVNAPLLHTDVTYHTLPPRDRSASASSDTTCYDETSSLLSHSSVRSIESQDTVIEPMPSKARTLFPAAQLACLCVCRLADPIMFTQILPYVNEMMVHLKVTDDPSRIGFYSGLVESSFAVSQLVSIYHWASLSDVIGRRPVIFIGIAGMAVGSVLFGLSRSLTGALLARCLSGLFSGNVAVLHSALGEIADGTNKAVAVSFYSIYGLCWPLGSIIGPLVGGLLINPASRFPNVQFFHLYPYFLPGLFAATVAFAGLAFGYLFLEETLPSKRRNLVTLSPDSQYDADKSASKPPSLYTLLQIPIIWALSSSGAALSFMSTAFDVLFVLFCYSPIESGGLAFAASEIGTALAMAGCISVLIQIFVTPVLLARCDHYKLYNTCMSLWAYCFAILPLINLLARTGFSAGDHGGALNLADADVRVRALVWCAIGATLALTKLACLAYAISMILCKESAGAEALGRVNGLVQLFMCFARAFSPAFVSSIFAASLKYSLLGGYAWSVAMVGISVMGTTMSRNIQNGRESASSRHDREVLITVE